MGASRSCRFLWYFGLLLGCGQSDTDDATAGWVAVALDESSGEATGHDAMPRLALAYRATDGERLDVSDRAAGPVAFRDGIAFVDGERRLVFASPNGTRRVLARRAGAMPARGPGGELIYTAQYPQGADVHVLDPEGHDRIVARGLASAGVLSLQPDGRLVMVGARSGGVAGVWLVDAHGPRCLTNCDLKVGAPWHGRFVPLPRDSSSIRVTATHVEWQADDGTLRTVPLPVDPESAPNVGGSHE